MPRMLASALLGFVLMVWALDFFSAPYDDTDPPDGRSNLELHTDCLTGLQYLSSFRGGLTPRLDREGNQIMDRKGC